MEDSQKKYIVVTGSNKGIGFATVEAILKRKTDYGLILTSRSEVNGNEAIKKLTEKYPDTEPPLFLQLDLLSDDSISAFVGSLSQKCGAGSIQVFINNAGLFKMEITPEAYSLQWETNYVQTRKLTEQVLDAKLLESKGKLINVSSMMGKIDWLEECNPELFKKFSDYKNLTLEDLDSIGEQMRTEFVNDGDKRSNWPPYMYNCAKMWVTLWTNVLSRNLPDLGYPDLQIYSLHPGWVLTDMTRFQLDQGITPPLNEEQGCETTVHLALELPFELNPELQGEYFADCKLESMIVRKKKS